jgi:hypothetical protein
MYEIELRIADLDLEIDLLRTSLQATSDPDAQQWLMVCLNICLRERIKLVEQFRLATLTSLCEPLRERSVGEAVRAQVVGFPYDDP